MWRITFAELRHHVLRSIALLVGLLVAVGSFTVLTAASSTSHLRTVGTIRASGRPAYDILVRPPGAQTTEERQTTTVEPNFLSGVYGGITLAQWRTIQRLSGVEVAAPIAMVGYSLPTAALPLPLPRSASRSRSLYRTVTTWVSAGGSSRVTQPATYVYLTPDRISTSPSNGNQYERAASGRRVQLCPIVARSTGPFSASNQEDTTCTSTRSSATAATVRWSFPMLIAAVDPDSEAQLDGLKGAVIDGRYLGETAAAGRLASPGGSLTTFPVLAAASSGVDEQAVTTVERLPTPNGPEPLSQTDIGRLSACAARRSSA